MSDQYVVLIVLLVGLGFLFVNKWTEDLFYLDPAVRKEIETGQFIPGGYEIPKPNSNKDRV